MSYARFHNSDLYVYQDQGDGFYYCAGCRLKGGPGLGHYEFSCTSAEAMLAHVVDHQIAGHKVHKRTIDRLKKRVSAEEELLEQLYYTDLGRAGKRGLQAYTLYNRHWKAGATVASLLRFAERRPNFIRTTTDDSGNDRLTLRERGR